MYVYILMLDNYILLFIYLFIHLLTDFADICSNVLHWLAVWFCELSECLAFIGWLLDFAGRWWLVAFFGWWLNFADFLNALQSLIGYLILQIVGHVNFAS